MKVEIEPGSGFCFGVENAVRIAEEALHEGEKVYCLGEIVHNDIEVARLKKMGMVTITYDEFEKLHDCKVLVRAHGEPPSTYEKARQNNISIIDATCPIVHSMQEKIKKVQLASREANGQIVIYGKEGHAEVIGLMGAAGEKGILVTGKEDIGRIDFTRPVWLFAQTTRSKAEYELVAEIIRLNLEKEAGKHPGNDLKVHKTICRQVSDREPRLRTFASNHEVIIFVSGKKSSNGRMLYDVCRKENSRSYFISSPGEIDPEWLRDVRTAGICGATSTPKWLIQKVAEAVGTI
ncbi:MAG: 4-hydroxy-3-methylbut-2-enyl diphosphate reductase [Bacteroidales bacterium]|nr:4-hydroxy-3-methylbut-2-enyl diphosphate reductase [Bacteroidales bacterium]